ncbi:keto-hydroxyglutarate-aldolase/keto-deoxy-phosphogluconate aldolase [Pasteurella multocida subsp. multocida str. Anand1_cattle]|nr:keto-hydroxyglutarate-aldolase/keto-deoxy-phosphogluconate aldolase [Pasteurella multocida subsp. multocida str. Anand1_cattle]
MAIEAALEMGIHAVKFFPVEASGGVAMIKALLGPYPMLQIMPTGGIHFTKYL